MERESDELSSLSPDVGRAWNAMVSHVGGPGQSDPVKGWVLSRGIRAVLYDPPAAPDLSGAPVTEGWAVAAPWGQNPVRYMVQPFPLIGWIELEWRLPPSVVSENVNRSAWRVIERHLNEMRRTRDVDAERAASWLAHAAEVAPLPPRGTADVTGQWGYRAADEGGRPGERGKVFLRSNGAYVIGVLDLGTNHREPLTGTITGDGKALTLTRVAESGRRTVLHFTLRGTSYVGGVEGSRVEIQLVRR